MKDPRHFKRLVDAAVSAQKMAYCPYSRYPVGAAVLTASGRVFAGCNVENASYGLSICAERAAIFAAVGRNQRQLRAVCIVGRSARPCGACRQVMLEFSTRETELYLVNLNPATRRQSVARTRVCAMLPQAFDPLASGLLPVHPQSLLREGRRTKPRSSRRRAGGRRRRPR